MSGQGRLAEDVLGRVMGAFEGLEAELSFLGQLEGRDPHTLSTREQVRAALGIGRLDLIVRMMFGEDQLALLPSEARDNFAGLRKVIDQVLEGAPPTDTSPASFTRARDEQIEAGPARLQIETYLNGLSRTDLETLAGALAQGGQLRAVRRVPAHGPLRGDP